MKNFKLSMMAFMVVAISSFTFTMNAQQTEIKERKQRTFDAEQMQENRLEKLKTELNLTEQQEAEVKALMDERQKEMEKHRTEREEAMKAMRDKHVEQVKAVQERQKAHDAKMKDILSPEQYEKYEQLNNKQKEAMKEKMKERRSDRMERRKPRMSKEKPVQE
ncbi:Spy/CpxP family protein refolding chaperone [Geofilum rubicundum]|uniref:Uncharacterized protein n=1 Tax=Geofilum rubicundum JCM 15548 TaxID=1236989 RepID=A0A0E9LUQ6_9BACT|nr:Spy/CpxP family protein refolding chaperone [Geofilum rubicundum]GAO29327.1 hypothetical protein JCM15548_11502 [Geofilum rubicundum JCM 15548]